MPLYVQRRGSLCSIHEHGCHPCSTDHQSCGGHHAPSGPERFADDARNAAARYKAGIRQRELFEKTVNRILTRESIAFHESLFAAPMLFPEQDIAVSSKSDQERVAAERTTTPVIPSREMATSDPLNRNSSGRMTNCWPPKQTKRAFSMQISSTIE